MEHRSEDAPVLVAFGNPLLDTTAVVKDKSLHQKFNLPIDGQLEVSKEQRKLINIVQEKYYVEQTAGGCALNSSRVFSWVLGRAGKVVFFGGIGEDAEAQKLEDIIHKSGVTTKFVKVKDRPTGTCTALVLDAERCLCADIGAASVCEPENVFTPEGTTLLDNAQYIYVEGYFITHSFNTALKLAQYSRKKNKTFIFNLCGSYVCQNHSNELRELLPFIDILFGYVEEYKSLEKHVNLKKLLEHTKNTQDKDNLVENTWRVLQAVRGKENIIIDSPKSKGPIEESMDVDIQSQKNGVPNMLNGTDKGTNHGSWWRRQKLVIVTQGPKPLLYSTNKCVRQRPVIPINAADIVDTTGAGDSFVGGFLAALSNGESLQRCLDCGTWTAQHILKQKGCTLPTYRATFLS